VKAIYEAFGRGDVTTILDKLDDAVEWETTVPLSEVPWLHERRGKANIAGFFQSMAPLTITRFEPHTIFDGGDKVFVLIAFEATAGGNQYSFPNNGHLWQFNAAQGRQVRPCYRHCSDDQDGQRRMIHARLVQGTRWTANQLANIQMEPTRDGLRNAGAAARGSFGSAAPDRSNVVAK
jgi:hypothetical protein